MTDQNLEAQDQDDIEEDVGASYGDPSTVMSPVTPAGGSNHHRPQDKSAGEKALVKQGNSPKTKAGMMGAVVAKMNKMSAADMKSLHKAVTGGSNAEGVIMQGNSKIKEGFKLTTDDIDVSDDMAAMLGDADLSEEFKTKAEEVFATAVVTRVNEALASVNDSNDEEMADLAEQLTTKLDEYLDYVVDQYMEVNELAIQTGLQAELAEDFMVGLKDLLVSHYVDIPEDKVDVLEDFASRNEDLEDALNEEMNKNIVMSNELDGIKQELVFAEVSEGLSLTDSEKMATLAESINFTDTEDYTEKLETIKESYFTDGGETGTDLDLGTEELSEEALLEEGEEVVSTSPAEVQRYADAMSRTMPRT
jgi:hypothetical protein